MPSQKTLQLKNPTDHLQIFNRCQIDGQESMQKNMEKIQIWKMGETKWKRRRCAPPFSIIQEPRQGALSAPPPVNDVLKLAKKMKNRKIVELIGLPRPPNIILQNIQKIM